MTTIEKKIQKKVDEINKLIALANLPEDTDVENSYDGKVMVVDTSSTWEEPAIYEPIVFRNGVLYIEYFEPYSNRIKKEKILKRDLEYDGYGTLLDIAKMYKKALKRAEVKFEKGGVTENYVSRKELNTITIKKGNQKLTYKISDVLNGAYKLESGAKLEDIAFYVPKRNIVKVQLKTGKDFKPANGYWIKDGAKPIHVTKFDDGGSLNDYELFLKLKNSLQPNQRGFNESELNGYTMYEKNGEYEITRKISGNEIDVTYNFKKFFPYKSKSKFEVGGKTTFKEKATAIAKKFEGKRVEPKYQKEYGKVYDKEEAKEVGNKIVGSQKAKYDAKAEKGAVVKKGKGNHKMKATTDLARKIRKEGEKWTDAIKRANEQLK